MMNQEIGKKYGNLIVIAETKKRYHSTKIYKCLCICGNIVEVNINKLHLGHTKSCGCLRHKPKDLIGIKFGRLEVLEFAYTKNNANYSKFFLLNRRSYNRIVI